jgi:transcriptional regulator with XRE-family HTH domain/ketosteroid isomerase-like protein
MDQGNIGKFIAKLRKDKKMTQEELANKLGVNSRSVSRWENGKCMPDLSLLVPLSKELGMNVNDLLSGKKNDKEGYQEAFEENIANIVSIVDKDKKRYKLKVAGILLGIILIAIPLIVLSVGQFFKVYSVPSFSSFGIINKANQFYKALQNNDVDKIDKLMTDNVEDEMCWFTTDDFIVTKQNFLDNLKLLNSSQKRVKYTSFSIKQFRYIESAGEGWEDDYATPDESDVWVKGCEPTMKGFAVSYELCFKDWSDEKACIMLEFSLNNDGKLAFMTYSEDINISNEDIKKKYSPIYYPLSVGNSYYNPLHVFVEDVFYGYELKTIEENVDSWLNR